MGRLRGCLWLTAGIVTALLAAFVGYVSLSRATVRQAGEEEAVSPRVSVVVAAQAISVRAALAAADLQLKEFPVETVPEGAFREVSAAEGKITLVDLYPGEIVVAQRLLDPNVIAADGRQALIVADDQVLMAMPADDLLSKAGVLKPGDHVDLLFSFDFPANRGPEAQAKNATTGAAAEDKKEKVTFNLLQNVIIAGVVGGPQQKASGMGGAVASATGNSGEAVAPKAILITISPQDALVLKQMRDSGAILDLVLRAPNAEQPFVTEPVDVDYIIKRYRIPVGVER